MLPMRGEGNQRLHCVVRRIVDGGVRGEEEGRKEAVPEAGEPTEGLE